MPRLPVAAAVTGVAIAMAGLVAISGTGMAAAAPKPAEVPLAGSSASFTSRTPATGDVAGLKRLSIQVWLAPDSGAAQRYATAVSTPGSGLFGHYLSPEGYTARFGATRAEAGRVESWLRSAGFTGVHADPQRSYVRATAPTSVIDAAFAVTLKTYRPSMTVSAGRYPLRANDRPVSVPAFLAGSVLGVTGLDNASPGLPLARAGQPPAAGGSSACSAYYGQKTRSGLPEHFGTTSFPVSVCGYTARQMRMAYGASTVNTGKGQTIAFVEQGLAPRMYRTLKDYAARGGISGPSPHRYAELSLGKGDTCGDPFYAEEQLDVEAAYDMAPAANQLVVGGDSCDNGDHGFQGLVDADVAILDGGGSHPLAPVVSNSWLNPAGAQPSSLTDIEHAFLVRAAAEGVGMYFCSGDLSGVYPPASDPDAIAVGGTTLGLGKTGNRLFQTGWSSAAYLVKAHRWALPKESGAAGGGRTPFWPQPAYQKGVVPASMSGPAGNRARSVPDISADADPSTGMAVGMLGTNPGVPGSYVQIDYGGTSLATPLVAGIVTAAQQGETRPFGFLDPAIYKLAGTSAYDSPLPETRDSPVIDRAVVCPAPECYQTPLLLVADDQNPSITGSPQVTVKGYNNMTGVGTPDGPRFIAALRELYR